MYPAVHEVAHRQVAALVLAVSAPGEWILECGAGDGHLASLLEARRLRVLAVDPRGGPGVARAGWEALPVRDGAVAAVTACASLHYAPDPREAVREAARALRPGGVLVASLSPVHDTDEGARAGERVARRRTGMARYRHLSMSEVNAAFGGAGLALEIKEFRVPGRVGAVRRAKQVIGIDLAHFPTLVGRKPPL